MSRWLWIAGPFALYAILATVAAILIGSSGWLLIGDVLLYAGVLTTLHLLIGRCFTRRRGRQVVIGGIGICVLIAVAWSVAFGPVRTRLDARYGSQAAAKYGAWLRQHGRAETAVSSCSPVRMDLEVYGRPSFYSCAVGSSPHCVFLYKGVTDFGKMTAGRCSYLAND